MALDSENSLREALPIVVHHRLAERPCSRLGEPGGGRPRGCRIPLKAAASILSIRAGMHQRRRRRDRLCVGQRRLR
jgi:hypothetical protein